MPLPFAVIPILGFFKKYWIQLIAVLFVVGVIFAGYMYIKGKDDKIAELQKENASLVIQRDTYKQNWQDVKGALDEQNSVIANLSQQFKDSEKNFSELKTLIGTKTGQLSSKLDGIKKGPVPKTCPESIEYLYDAAKEYKK